MRVGDTRLRAGDVQRAVLPDGAAEHGAVAQVQAALHDGPRLLVVPRAAVLIAVAEGAQLLLLRKPDAIMINPNERA